MKTHLKNLVALTITLSLSHSFSALADLATPHLEQTCQAESVACKNIVAVLNSIDYSAPAKANESINKGFLDFKLPAKQQIYAENTLKKEKGNCDAFARQSSYGQNNTNPTSNTFGAALMPLESSEVSFFSPDKINVDYDKISQSSVRNCNVDVVPAPTAGWLFASALIAFITFSNRRRA